MLPLAVDDAGQLGSEEVPVTQEFVASMLGLRRPTVTLIFGDLVRSGVIEYRRGFVTMKARQALERSQGSSPPKMGLDADTQHRPWSLPAEPWILTQSWNDLLFLHWPVAPDRLRNLVPPFLEIDTFDNEAWLGIVPFRLTDLSPRGVPPIPWVSAFDEINVRTYVISEERAGVYFFSLDANSALAVGGARALFHLPYFLADIKVEQIEGTTRFTSRRTHDNAVFHAAYAPAGPVFEPQIGTLDYWLTERYCLYTQSGSSNAFRVEIHHRPWPLQRADAQIEMNTMSDAAGVRLPSMAPLLHFARRQEVLTWAPQRLR